MNTNNESPNVGHNNGPALDTTEKVEVLLDATLDAILERVQSDDCNGTDLGAAVKVLKEVGALQVVANNRALLNSQLHQNTDVYLDDFDEHGHVIAPPANRPSR